MLPKISSEFQSAGGRGRKEQSVPSGEKKKEKCTNSLDAVLKCDINIPWVLS